MPKKPMSYDSSYRKPSKAVRNKAGMGMGSHMPPVQSDANEIAFSNQQTRYPKQGGKNSRPHLRK